MTERGNFLTIARTSYFAILDRTLGEGGGVPGPSRLAYPLIEIEQTDGRKRTEIEQGQTERLRCSESKHTRFYRLRLHFDIPRGGQNVTCRHAGYMYMQFTSQVTKCNLRYMQTLTSERSI